MNLILACSACHVAHHRGALTIIGTADQLEVRRSAEPRSTATVGAHVGAVATGNAGVGAPTELDAAIVRAQVKEALIGLGWKPAIANSAVAAASAALTAETTLEPLIVEALRRCRRPMS